MNILIKNVSGIAGRLALFVITFAVIGTLCALVSGGENFVEQFNEILCDPNAMTGELLQNLASLSKLPILNDVVNVYFAGSNALVEGDVQRTIFNDLYFVVLSALIIQPIMYIYHLFKNGVGNINNGVISFICDALISLYIAYAGTALAIVVGDAVGLKIFKGNYVLAFFIMVGVQMLISAVSAFFGLGEDKSFLNSAGEVFVDFLFQVCIFACVLFGNAILFKGWYDPLLIFLFIFCFAALMYSVYHKRKFSLLRKKK